MNPVSQLRDISDALAGIIASAQALAKPMSRAIKRAGKRYAHQLSICPPHVNASRARKFAAVLIQAGHPVSPVVIIQRIAVPNAVAQGSCVCEIEPDGASAGEFMVLYG